MAYPPQPPHDPNQPRREPIAPDHEPWAPGPQQHEYAPAPKPPNSKLVFWTSGTGVVLMLLIAFVAVIVLAGVVNRIQGPAGDKFGVTVTSCNATGTTLATATIGLAVRNTGKSTASATVKIEYRDGSGSRIDTDTAYVRDIAPGDTARTEETTILDAAPTGSISCEVVGVS
jgi:hypothetical protein